MGIQSTMQNLGRGVGKTRRQHYSRSSQLVACCRSLYHELQSLSPQEYADELGSGDLQKVFEAAEKAITSVVQAEKSPKEDIVDDIFDAFKSNIITYSKRRFPGKLDDLQSKMDEACRKDKQSSTRRIIVDLKRKAQKPLDDGNLIKLDIVWSGTATDLRKEGDPVGSQLKVGPSSTLDAILWLLAQRHPTRVASNPHLYSSSAIERIRDSNLEPGDTIDPVPFTDTIDKIIQSNRLPLHVLADKESYVFLKSPTNPRVFRNIWTLRNDIILKDHTGRLELADKFTRHFRGNIIRTKRSGDLTEVIPNKLPWHEFLSRRVLVGNDHNWTIEDIPEEQTPPVQDLNKYSADSSVFETSSSSSQSTNIPLPLPSPSPSSLVLSTSASNDNQSLPSGSSSSRPLPNVPPPPPLSTASSASSSLSSSITISSSVKSSLENSSLADTALTSASSLHIPSVPDPSLASPSASSLKIPSLTSPSLASTSTLNVASITTSSMLSPSTLSLPVPSPADTPLASTSTLNVHPVEDSSNPTPTSKKPDTPSLDSDNAQKSRPWWQPIVDVIFGS